ncbi:DNA mismatch repair protein MutS-like N-terminal domain-containing protein [Entamoeba marina]
MSKPLDIETQLKYSNGGCGAKQKESQYEFLLNIQDKSGKKLGDPNYDPTTLYIPPDMLNAMKPFEKQYWEIKMNNYDVVLFFQKGKFYELYESDADVGNKELGLKIMDRVKMRMVGIPLSFLNTCVEKLLKLGFKVGCVNEINSNDRVKQQMVHERGYNIIDRQLVKIYTPSTTSIISTMNDNGLNTLL